VLSNNKRSDETTLEEFDHINAINYRGGWLSSRAAIKQMLTQEPLPTHDGRPGTRGSVVNIASQLGIVGRPAARKSRCLRPTQAWETIIRREKERLTDMTPSGLLWLESSSNKHDKMRRNRRKLSSSDTLHHNNTY
jgi:NAD(P)-dependent dehydrogenase (short-subunit alcohol dehydrogenase family)